MNKHSAPLAQLQFIAGVFRSGNGDKIIPVIDPATTDTIAQFSVASQTDLDEALVSADHGFKIWKAETAQNRQLVLNRAANLIEERVDDIAADLTAESGKPLAEAKMELGAAINILRWYAEEGKRVYGRVIAPPFSGLRQTVIKEPVGPALAFIAWNFPAVNFIRKVGAALSAGCSMILKPADETPLVAIKLAKAFHDAGLPTGVLNVVNGDPATISSYLCASPVPRKLSFTGSVPVGQSLLKQASENLLRTTMELGGHAPFIVFEDADLEAAAKLMIAGKFRNAGQVCVSPTRFYVHRKVKDKFMNRVLAHAKAIRVGPGRDPGTTMGPLINQKRVEAVQDLIEDAIQHGATLAWQGDIPAGEGTYHAPTILDNVPETSRIMNEEPFGPVAMVATFDDTDEAIQRANRLQFGLAAYAFTKNAATAARLSAEIEAGMLAINSLQIATPETPFGGIGWSGHGSEGGSEGIEAYLQTRLVTEIFN